MNLNQVQWGKKKKIKGPRLTVGWLSAFSGFLVTGVFSYFFFFSYPLDSGVLSGWETQLRLSLDARTLRYGTASVIFAYEPFLMCWRPAWSNAPYTPGPIELISYLILNMSTASIPVSLELFTWYLVNWNANSSLHTPTVKVLDWNSSEDSHSWNKLCFRIFIFHFSLFCLMSLKIE